jgi:uncharacterized integral membrane protein
MSTQERPAKERSPKQRNIASKTIAALAVAILLIAFGLSNRNDVPIDWLVTTTSTPLIVVILVSAALGAILGGLAVRTRTRRAVKRSKTRAG